MRRPVARLAACVLLALALAGCITDGLAPHTSKRDSDDPDAPKRMCEATSVGGTPKTVCY